jgi:hypothetical protein
LAIGGHGSGHAFRVASEPGLTSDDRTLAHRSVVSPAGRGSFARDADGVLNSSATLNVIETERLLLEPLNVSRLEEFVVLMADPEVMRYWGTGGLAALSVATWRSGASRRRSNG